MRRRPNRLLAYLRVSGAEQGRTGTSLEGQRAEVERWRIYQEYPEPVFFIEVASAGAEKLEHRIELKRLLATAKEGDMIVVCKVDRWSRDMVWAVQSVRELVKRGVGWYSIGESLDASTTAGDSTLGIMSWVADQERVRIKERTVGRRRELRDLGMNIEGRVPIGYERHQRRLRIVEADAIIVREVYSHCLNGKSIGDICLWLRATYPTRHGWDHKTVHHVLRSRIYLGEMMTTKRVWMPAHQPVVDVLIWNKAQTELNSRRNGGHRSETVSRTSRWLVRDVGICAECDTKVAAAYGPSSRVWGYYVCRARLRRSGCDAPYVPVAKTDAAVSRLAVERLKSLRVALAKVPEKPSSPQDADFDIERAKLKARRARTIDLETDGTITREDMRARVLRIDDALSTLQVKAALADRRAAIQTPARRAEVLANVEIISAAWRRATIEQRREIVRRMVRCVRLHANHEPAPEWLELEEMLTLEAHDVANLFEPPPGSSEDPPDMRRAARPKRTVEVEPDAALAFRAKSHAWMTRKAAA